MMLRIQKERMTQASLPDGDRYFAKFGLTPERLALAKPDAIVMHPQPMNRGIEIASDVADGRAIGHPRSGQKRRRRTHGGARGRRTRAGHVRVSAASRGTIFLEEGRVLEQAAFDAGQFVIRIEAPKCAAHATPGSFAHLTCHETIPMRRPLSLMRADARAGWVEILYKVEGSGLHALSQAQSGDTLSILGPIGCGFTLHPARPRAVLIGGGVGIPPVVFLAEHLLSRKDAPWAPLAFMGSEVPFPFRAQSARTSLAGIAAEVSASMPLMNDWGIASRLASRSGFTAASMGS
jgi:hypothetical protein